MARSRDVDEVLWLRPVNRAILPLGAIHVSRRLQRHLRKLNWHVTVNRCFSDVMRLCAGTRPETWINDPIRQCFILLHEMGHAHSIEVWDDDELIGGLYGLSIKAAFFGESIFSLRSDAGKFALIQLHDRLIHRNYKLLDCQFYSSFLASMGAIEISNDDFQKQLKYALCYEANFTH